MEKHRLQVLGGCLQSKAKAFWGSFCISPSAGPFPKEKEERVRKTVFDFRAEEAGIALCPADIARLSPGSCRSMIFAPQVHVQPGKRAGLQVQSLLTLTGRICDPAAMSGFQLSDCEPVCSPTPGTG